MAKFKPYVPDRFVFDVAEKQFGIHIDEHELVIDEDAIATGAALGPPSNDYPEMLEDPVERKKAFISYVKQMHGFFFASYARARENRARANASSSSEANIPSSTVMAEPGSDGLKTGTLPTDSTPL